MKRRTFLQSGLLLAGLNCTNHSTAAHAQEKRRGNPTAHNRVPVSGKLTRGVQPFDGVMLHYLEQIGCSAATLAIAFRGKLVHSRGYGWRDEARTIATEPETMIGIASCEKPLTAASIHKLAFRKQIDLDASVFRLLEIQPQGAVVDDRIWQVTVRNLLEHKSGWQGDPFARALDESRRKSNGNPLTMESLLGQLMTQQLSDAPGTRYEYCNFCYDTLRHIVSHVSGKSPIAYVRTQLFRPAMPKDLVGVADPNAPTAVGDPPLVWNNDGGPVSASSPALCTFMTHFWGSGSPRDRSNQTWAMYGSLPGSTAMMVWRSDGIDIAAIFNGRGKPTHDQIKGDLELMIGK
ncbi:MAG: serine hydrolase domain-containing protein [Planctomycetaceae bacterium]|nr:serine hydrolase domain-containing protein [Planctomycetaceae bacterium]